MDTSPSPLARARKATVLVVLILFLLLTAVVQARMLAGLDLAVTQGKQSWVSPALVTASAVANIGVSAEMSVLYGLIASFLLWRAGAGVWALAPLAFLFLLPVEMAMKLLVDQPTVPPEYQRAVYYPLTSVHTPGSFPSGHAMRSAFFCAFAAVLIECLGGRAGRYAPWALAALAAFLGFTRIYLGVHWTSDVVGGLLLGTALALAVTPPVAARLARRRF